MPASSSTGYFLYSSYSPMQNLIKRREISRALDEEQQQEEVEEEEEEEEGESEWTAVEIT
ncbi:hypothetical protein V1477_002521 [Vespula maculifrons]|uniref:Uncharacterized protein n=1 Tax=Vespula maculifrons TaxID=7453 RepID=A0ABD2CX25_VESMC